MSELKEKYIQFCCDFYNEHAPEDKIWFGRMFDDCHQEHNKRNSSMYRWQFPLKVLKDQQAIIDDLKSQLNNMEACYIQVKKERDELQVRASELLEGVESAMVQLDNWTTAYEILDELRGERESFTETRQKVEAQIENGARLAKHQIDL